MMDPKARTPRLQELLAEFDRLVKEQCELIVKDEMEERRQTPRLRALLARGGYAGS
jgi:hypothetical protein